MKVIDEEKKMARREAHLKFMNQCFLEANNILAQSLSRDEYNEKHAQGFREGYWMAKWIDLGDDGIYFGIE